MSCQFCEIEKEKDRIIYKDSNIVVFPTIIPIVPGHVLICPVRHVEKIDELSEEELKDIKKIIIKNSLKKSFKVEGFNIAWNEGSMAGQAISHMHIHIVPRKSGDVGIYQYDPRKFLYRPGSRAESPTEELYNVAKIIKDNL
jgi:diadenosine tetraphosphate (Ap4A) HIT family hydrolase